MGLYMELIRSLYNYREFLMTNVKKEIRGKYKGSFLGVLWSFINPLLQVIIYWLIFPYLMGNTVDNYLIYLVCGIIPWTFFTTVVSQGMVTVRSNAGIIKKVYFPRELLPISVVISGLINFLISCIIILIFTVAGGVGISWHLILLPVLALLQSLLSLGLAFALSAINIYVKDTEYIVGFVLNMAFYATPILYTADRFAENQLMMWVFKLNPMAHIIDAYRDIFLYHQLPTLGSLGYVFAFSMVVLLIGYVIFKKLEKGFAEEI